MSTGHRRARLFEHKNIGHPVRGSRYFGASVLIGLLEKCAHTNVFRASDIIRFHPHPYGMRLKSEGLSHGLKTCHRHVFLTAFRVPPPIPEKTGYPTGIRSFLVREMGLEPTRRNHTHLKRACLPFQHSRKCLFIIMQGRRFVNCFLLCRTAKMRAEFCLKSFKTG